MKARMHGLGTSASPFDRWYNLTKKDNGDYTFVLRNTKTGKEVNVSLSRFEFNKLLIAIGPLEVR